MLSFIGDVAVVVRFGFQLGTDSWPGDLPHAAGLAQTKRVTEPDIGHRTVGAASRQVNQRGKTRRLRWR
jgi:hypothetical protein